MIRTLLALAVALPWVAWAVVRSFGLDSGRLLVPAISFTPYVAATALVPVVVALLLRRRSVALLGVAACAALVVAVAPRAFDGPEPAVAGSGPTLRVLSANLGYGNADPEALVALAERYDADLVSLQELTPAAVATLDRAGWAGRYRHRVLDPLPGARGSGLLARHPLTDPVRPPGLRLAMPEATLHVPGAAPIRVKAIHPVAPLRDDVAVWRAAMRDLPRATPDGGMRMLVGDFNATLDHSELRDLLASGYVDAADAVGAGLQGTYPARGRVRIAIDHVLADRRMRVTDAAVHLVPGTDHRAVTAAIRLPRLAR